MDNSNTYDATARPSDILEGKTAVVKGKEITGTITSQNGGTITPRSSSQVVAKRGKYVTDAIEIAGDSNLVSENIRKGVTIFDVTGVYEGAKAPDKLPEGVYNIILKSEPEGAGLNFKNKIASKGMNVSVNAEPSDWPYSFKEWVENGEKIGDNSTLSFDVNSNKIFIAYFNVAPHYKISVSEVFEEVGSITGAGLYHPDEEVTLTATPNISGKTKYKFTGWEENGEIVNENETYTFIATEDRNLVAKFEVDNSVHWAISTGLPTSSNSYKYYWQDIAFGNGSFITVCGNSSDNNHVAAIGSGTSWSMIILPEYAFWNAIAYGNDIFVAISGRIRPSNSSSTYNNMVAYKSGSHWYSSTLPSKDYWSYIAYGNGVFVVIAKSGTACALSRTANSWNLVGLPSYAINNSLTYAHDRFMIFRNSGEILQSTDGISWNSVTPNVSSVLTCGTYGNGKFVAIARDSNVAAYSENGIDWQETTIPQSANWDDIAYGNGKFVIVSSSKVAAYSLDGVVWDIMQTPIGVSSITYGNDIFVAVGTNEQNKAIYSI